MEYLIGLLVALLVAGLAAIVGLDRDRAFYPTVLMVIASYYVLFAVMGASGHTVVVEIILASAFFCSCDTWIQKKSLVCGRSDCWPWSV